LPDAGVKGNATFYRDIMSDAARLMMAMIDRLIWRLFLAYLYGFCQRIVLEAKGAGALRFENKIYLINLFKLL